MSSVRTVQSRVTGIVVVGVACLTLSCVRAGVSEAASEKGAKPFDPPAVYLTWQRDPTTTMTVQWHSDGGRDDVIQYQRLDERAWRTVIGSHHPMPYSERVVHMAELTGLEPGTEYRFRFGTHSVVFTFRTMPRDASKPIRFVVGGDTMESFDALDKWFEKGCRLVVEQDPMFMVIGGDIAYANGDPKMVRRWYRWLGAWKKHMVTSQGRLIPFLVVIGNHEVQGGFGQRPEKAPYFYSLFAMPDQRGYTVVDFGRYMSLILLDSEHTHAIDGRQADWLGRTLGNRQDVPHVFGVYHVPAYPSVRKFNNRISAKIRQHWIPLFEKFGLDVAFEHHDHAYKRTHPIRAGTVDPRGVLYLGDGAWGALPRKTREDWYLAKTASKQHFILVTIDGQSRTFQAIDTQGNVFDQVHHNALSPSTVAQ